MEQDRLRLCEAFESLQGESIHAGFPTLFLRLQGCAMRCRWCDTPRAIPPDGGVTAHLDELLARAAASPFRRVCVTGGEPLDQPATGRLLERLVEAGKLVSLETNGGRPLNTVPYEVHVVLDWKPPSACGVLPFLMDNLDRLKPTDEIKIVVDDTADLAFALDADRRHDLARRFLVSISPTPRFRTAHDAAAAILASGRDLRLNPQLHKILFRDPEA